MGHQLCHGERTSRKVSILEELSENNQGKARIGTMNKQAIADTAVCRWNQEDDCYIVWSPLFEHLIGVGDDQEEAWEVFRDLLDDAYAAYLEGKVAGYDKVGRPSKGGTPLNVDVKPHTKEYIGELSQLMNISRGESIDYLVAYFQAGKSMEDLVCQPTVEPVLKMVKEKSRRYALPIRVKVNQRDIENGSVTLKLEFSRNFDIK
jgi:hypothetical protein